MVFFLSSKVMPVALRNTCLAAFSKSLSPVLHCCPSIQIIESGDGGRDVTGSA